MMRKWRSISLTIGFSATLLAGCGDQNAERYLVPLEVGCSEFIPNSYIVHYSELTEDELGDVDEYPDTPDWQEQELTEEEDFAAANGDPEPSTPEMDFIVANGGEIEHVMMPEIPAFSAIIPDEVLHELRQNPSIAFIEQNCVAYTTATQTNPPWGLDRIDQRQLPLDQNYNYIRDGRNVDAYVIDTGVLRTHDEFEGRVRYLYSFYGEAGGDSAHSDPHGTHVAGIIGGRTYGVAKRARIYSLRVFGKNRQTTLARIEAAIRAAIRHHERVRRPAVANLSLSGPASRSLDDAVRRLVQSGITAVVAAGNDAHPACNNSPARVASAITVGATRSDDQAWKEVAPNVGSNWGSCVDLYAPGVGINSAVNTTNDSATILSGTSMAAPHVAGVVANYLQTHRRVTPRGVAKWLLSQASTGVVLGENVNADTKFLFAGNGAIVASADSASGGQLLIAAGGECGIDPYITYAEASFTVEPVPVGYKAVLSSTPDGTGVLSVDDALTIACTELTSSGDLLAGSTKSMHVSYHVGCQSGTGTAPEISHVMSDYRRASCTLTLQDECGVCVGNSNIYLAYVPL